MALEERQLGTRRMLCPPLHPTVPSHGGQPLEVFMVGQPLEASSLTGAALPLLSHKPCGTNMTTVLIQIPIPLPHYQWPQMPLCWSFLHAQADRTFLKYRDVGCHQLAIYELFIPDFAPALDESLCVCLGWANGARRTEGDFK